MPSESRARALIEAIIAEGEAEEARKNLYRPRGEETTSSHRSQVYVIACRKTHRVKVGIAQDPDVRCSSLQTGSPTKLEVISAWWEDDALTKERDLHEKMAAARLHGEWFDATHPSVAATLGSGATMGAGVPILPGITVPVR